MLYLYYKRILVVILYIEIYKENIYLYEFGFGSVFCLDWQNHIQTENRILIQFSFGFRFSIPVRITPIMKTLN